MSNVSNAKNVSKGIYVELKGATVNSVMLNGVTIENYGFTLTEKTERIGFEKFEKGMKVDLKAYLSPNNNKLFLNQVAVAGTEMPKGETKKLTAVITEITDKSISLDGEEFFFTKYTRQETEPSVDLSVDAEVYITANGKQYLNSIKAVGSDSDAADTSTKDENKTGKAPYSGTSGKAYRKPSNRKTVSGEISAASAKGVMIDQTWYILSPYSDIEDESLLEKGENVTVVYTFSESKSINYINKLSAVNEPVTA